MNGIQARFVAVGYEDEVSLGIEKLSVLLVYRRAGIGATLLKCAMTYAAKNGAATLWLGVMNENPAFKERYKKLGFRETGMMNLFQTSPFLVCVTEVDPPESQADS